MSDSMIRNCPWGYSCKQKWEDLKPTKQKDVRFCGDCQKEVFSIESRDEFIESIVLNRCISFSEDLLHDRMPDVEVPARRLMGVPRQVPRQCDLPEPVDSWDDDIPF